MAALSQSRESGIDHTTGISDVRFEGGQWTFKSDWARQGTAEFRLTRVRADFFEGASFLGGRLKEKNRWTRIE